jgi:hypothetical protein
MILQILKYLYKDDNPIETYNNNKVSDKNMQIKSITENTLYSIFLRSLDKKGGTRTKKVNKKTKSQTRKFINLVLNL